MRIACPSCEAEYEVPDGILAAHSKVRCARCGEEWHPVAGTAAPLPAALPAALPVEETDETRAMVPVEPAAESVPPTLVVPPRQPGSSLVRRAGSERATTAVLLGWVLTVLVLGGALYAGYAWRDRLMTAWPPSTRLYAALGLAH